MQHSKRLIFLLAPLFCWLISDAQQLQVGGRVTGADGAPISGVSVVVKGSQGGTVTSPEGRYTISVPSAATLVFSFVGYKEKEIPVNNNRNIDVQLETNDSNLNSVVVIGYGSQKKSDVTGSIVSIQEKQLREVPVTNPAQMLQGRAAGVYVLNTGNKPGDGVAVQIRGKRSFNAGNDPLYVIDGIPITGGLNDINPGDIESMDVLKDASATAIYGSRGANGVIIITTKRGKQGRTNVNYNGYYGISNIARYADIMNGEQFAEYKRESRRAVIDPVTKKPLYDDTDPNADARLFEAVELASIKAGTYTDYQRLMIRQGHSQNHEVNVNGGAGSTRFNLGLGYFQDIGIIPGQDFTRYTTRVNLDQSLGKRIKIGVSMLGTYSQRNGQDVNPYGQSSDFGALSENPLGKAYDSTGALIFLPTSDGLRSNPLSELVPGAVINRAKRFRLLTNIYGEVEVVNGLKFRTSISPDLAQNRLGDFRGRYTNVRRLGDPSAANSESFSYDYTWENLLTYRKKISKHSLDFTGLYSIQSHSSDASSASVAGLPVEGMEYYNLGAASIINGVTSAYENWTILSYMARINYSYDSRFLLTLTGRADGSSKFAQGNRWGYFPSVALGWNIINESFMQNVQLFTALKLRATYGRTGNEGIAPYQTNSLLTRTQYDFDGSAAFGYRPTSISNKDLRWETTESMNFGFDFGILNNRITGSFEVYQSKTTDLLLPKLLPISGGFASVLTNVGSKRNRGIEFSISTQNLVSASRDGFAWSTDLNLFTNKEEIIELSQGKVDDVGNLLFIGQPATVYYDFQKLGIWQLGEDAAAKQNGSAVGGIRVADLNKNGAIDPGDRTILGTDVPDLIGGMTNRFSYKGFDLSVVMFARLGNMIRSTYHGNFRFLSGRVNQYNVDYWTPANPTNAYPRPNSNQESPIYGSTLSYMDGSFLKFRNITLGYNFPEHLIGRLRAEGLRLYLSVQDPFIISPFVSKYNGIDPELPTNSTPPVRRFMLGANIHL
jgi:TonB-linked SusC/RagA family outer membrane protein